MSEFRNRLLTLRNQKGFSQQELADLIGTSQRQVSKYETGKNEPTANVLHNMAVALNTTTDYLLGRTELVERPIRNESDLDKLDVEILRFLQSQDEETKARIFNAIKALVPKTA